MTWRVRVDPTRCISSGSCIDTAPERFAFDEDRHSRAVSELVDDDDAVREAAAFCPVEAIILTDAVTGAPVDLD